MPDNAEYVRAELDAIRRLQEQESLRRGVEVTGSEAVDLWLERYADQFRKRYEDGKVLPGVSGPAIS